MILSLSEEIKYEIPQELSELATIIQDSKSILEEENEDGEKPYKFSTWLRAMKELIEIAIKLNNQGIIIEIPIIEGGVQDSIIIFWSKKNLYFILLTISSNNYLLPTFFIRIKGQDFIKKNLIGFNKILLNEYLLYINQIFLV